MLFAHFQGVSQEQRNRLQGKASPQQFDGKRIKPALPLLIAPQASDVFSEQVCGELLILPESISSAPA